MNNYSKIYTSKTLKNNAIVTMVALPMEESIMVPVSQAIDLMKQGENVLFFSFNHDSIKINKFFQEFLKNEEDPSAITGNLGIIDSHQIPEGADWIGFVEDKIDEVKSQMDLNYVFFDILSYVKDHPVRPANEELAISTLRLLCFSRNITSVLIKTVDMPVFTATQNQEAAKEKMDEIMSKDLMESLFKSRDIVHQSDFIIGIQREKQSFWKKLWKKIVNFLLFWRKRNNFTLRVLKNRYGEEKSYRLNLDMDNFKSEVL